MRWQQASTQQKLQWPWSAMEPHGCCPGALCTGRILSHLFDIRRYFGSSGPTCIRIRIWEGDRLPSLTVNVMWWQAEHCPHGIKKYSKMISISSRRQCDAVYIRINFRFPSLARRVSKPRVPELCCLLGHPCVVYITASAGLRIG